MSNAERRLDKLETICQRPPGGPTPEQWRELRECAELIAEERGLSVEEVMAETERVIAAEGWPPRSVTEPEAIP